MKTYEWERYAGKYNLKIKASGCIDRPGMQVIHEKDLSRVINREQAHEKA